MAGVRTGTEATMHNYLSNIIMNADGTPLVYGEVIHIVGSVTSSTRIRDVPEHSVKNIVCKISAHNRNGRIARMANNVSRQSLCFPPTPEISGLLTRMCAKYNALPNVFPTMELFGVAWRMAAGCTKYALFGELTPDQLRGGGLVSVRAINAMIDPMSVNEGAVYVGAEMVSNARNTVMSAFANAISGEGGTMYTNLLGINANGDVQIPNSTGEPLARGCHEGLRILDTLFKSCNQGALFAQAVAEGCHSQASVHGHTDEGAYTRRVMRQGGRAPPHGAIPIELVSGCAIPTPSRTVGGYRTVYFSICLATAGLSAMADPLIELNGKTYPSVLTSAVGGRQLPSEVGVGSAADSADLTTQWADCCGPWAANYARGLTEIFMTTGGIDMVVGRWKSKANELAGTDDRHMRFKAINAHYWTEPTCTVPFSSADYPAVAANMGPLATHGAPRTCPVFDGVALVPGQCDSQVATFQVDWRCARRHAALLHLLGNSRNGLSHMKFLSLVETAMGLVGSSPDGADVTTRLMRGDDMISYLWGRGDCELITPGELMSLSASNIVTTAQVVEVNGRPRVAHMFTEDEIVNGVVTFRCSTMTSRAPIAMHDHGRNRRVTHSRTNALEALVNAQQQGLLNRALANLMMNPCAYDPGEIRMGPGVGPMVDDPSNRSPPAQPAVPAAQLGNAMGRGPVAFNAQNLVSGTRVQPSIQIFNNKGPRPPIAGRIRGGPGAGGGGGGNNPARNNNRPFPAPGGGANVAPADDGNYLPPPDPAPPEEGGAGQGDGGALAAGDIVENADDAVAAVAALPGEQGNAGAAE